MREKSEIEKLKIIIGQNLRRLRLRRTVSQDALANMLGVTFQQVQKYEKGINNLSAARLRLAASVLDVPLEEFYSGHYLNVPGGDVGLDKHTHIIITYLERLPIFHRKAISLILKYLMDTNRGKIEQ